MTKQERIVHWVNIEIPTWLDEFESYDEFQKAMRFWSYVFEPHGDQIPDGIDFGEPLEALKV